VSTSPVSWLGRALRALSLALVRFYYPRLGVEGRERLPARGPAIVVANHPNGLLDPVVLQLAIGQPVRFWAKSTFFGNPFGRAAMAAFGCIPAFRAQDASTKGDRDRRSDRNEETFARSRQALREGAWLALFPEGTSHSDPQLRRLKTGAARIALSTLSEASALGAPIDLTIVPAGLGYEAKTIFRSGVLVRVGRPLHVAGYLDRHAGDLRAATETLTADIRSSLDEVVLQADTRELLEGVARVARWTSEKAGEGERAVADPGALDQRARALLAAHQVMLDRDPDLVERITRAVRDYARVLRHLGVRDPWGLEVSEVGVGAVLGASVRLLLSAPLAAIGAALGWAPYRLAGQVARRFVGRELDILGTVKLLAGSLFLLVAWTGEAIAAALLWRPLAALIVLALAPVTGYIALRFEEIWAETLMGVRHLWLRRAHPTKVARLVQRRRALADAVAQALLDVP
jgi:glycerol-3-phosphate O-acyltransferase/dihydroxyacetone phosphate acyltransferase